MYATAQSHSSVEKAALLAGFGRENLHIVEHDAAFGMRADALQAAIDADVADGRLPCAVVATVGTTTTTAIDPVAAIASIAERHGIWVHVDAAMAGSAMILPECRWMWDGVERADSVVVNPHKWLGAAFDCSVLVRAATRVRCPPIPTQGRRPMVVKNSPRFPPPGGGSARQFWPYPQAFLTAGASAPRSGAGHVARGRSPSRPDWRAPAWCRRPCAS